MKKFPIVFFAFRRPEKTRVVLMEILKHNPSKVYIFADGVRNASDRKKVAETRKVIDEVSAGASKIELIKVYRKNNYGLKKNIVEGLNLVFRHEVAAIVLEDDCLPSQSYFDFCDMALELYKDREDITTVCGTNMGEINAAEHNKCLTSRFFVPWGWALWKRTWVKYIDTSDADILRVRDNKDISFSLRWYLSEVYKLTLAGTINTWDYKMIIMQMINNTYSLVPPFNMIENIGFGAESTNTAFSTSASNLAALNKSISLCELKGPEYSKAYDSVIIKKIILTPVSMLGLLVRKYFPVLTKQIYK